MDNECGSIIYGRNPVLEALNEGVEIEKILIQRNIEGAGKKIFALAKKRSIPLQGVDKAVLDRIIREQATVEETPRDGKKRRGGNVFQADGSGVGTKAGVGVEARHQGVIAYLSAFTYRSLEGVLGVAEDRGEPPFVLVLDGIEDPQNLGAILRSAEGAGVHGVVIPKRRAVSVNETVIKVSAGAALHMAVARVSNISATLDELKARGLWVYGLDMDGTDYRKTDFAGGVAVVIGAEGRGLSHLVREKCDHIVSIPMQGKVASLNASNASAIVLFAVSGQRTDGESPDRQMS
jgi:23S rRNA (guanosine2251-2'-O)-methyltransferase